WRALVTVAASSAPPFSANRQSRELPAKPSRASGVSRRKGGAGTAPPGSDGARLPPGSKRPLAGRSKGADQRLKAVAQGRLQCLGAGAQGGEVQFLIQLGGHQQGDVALLHRALPVMVMEQAAQQRRA